MNNFYCNSLTNGQFKKFVTNFEQRTNRERHLIKSGRDFIYPGLLSILMLQKDLENSTEIIIQNYWKWSIKIEGLVQTLANLIKDSINSQLVP